MKEYIPFRELKGKVIDDILEHEGDLVIFIGDRYIRFNVSFDQPYSPFSLHYEEKEALNFGILTKEEYDELIRKNNEERAANELQQRRKSYERLKDEFDPQPK